MQLHEFCTGFQSNVPEKRLLKYFRQNPRWRSCRKAYHRQISSENFVANERKMAYSEEQWTPRTCLKSVLFVCYGSELFTEVAQLQLSCTFRFTRICELWSRKYRTNWAVSPFIGIASYGALGHVHPSTSNCLIFHVTLEPHKLRHWTPCGSLSNKKYSGLYTGWAKKRGQIILAITLSTAGQFS